MLMGYSIVILVVYKMDNRNRLLSNRLSSSLKVCLNSIVSRRKTN